MKMVLKIVQIQEELSCNSYPVFKKDTTISTLFEDKYIKSNKIMFS